MNRVCEPVTSFDLLMGFATTLVDLVDTKPTEVLLRHQLIGDQIVLGNYSPGLFGWVTSNRRRGFKPFPVTGQQGLFQVELPEGITL